MSTSHHALLFEGVAKAYGKNIVLADVNLNLNQGEYLGLVGVNGAGKTTMIKCLLDFCAINAGSITIFDVPHTRTNARRRLTFLPEKFMPPYYLTGRNFLTYMAELNGNDYDESKASAILDVLDLDKSALSKSVRQYSKGMGQKLGLAACLLSDKELMVFDEPMSGLDPKARASVKQYLLELKKSGKTLFFSTHFLADVEALCDRLAILHEGRICFIGTPTECNDYYNADDLEHAYMQCVER